MKNVWQEIEAHLTEKGEDISDILNPGASDDEIEELEERIGKSLPDSFKEFYKIHNGQSAESPYLAGNYFFILPLDQIQDEMDIWEEIVEDMEEEEDEETSEAEKGIKNDWWNPLWIPFAANGGGDNLCLDLDPEKEGKEGQIITLWHDMPERKKVADSFKVWAEGILKNLS